MASLDHDLECASVYRKGGPCTCAVGVLERLRSWSRVWPPADTEDLIRDARDYMRRLIELHNERVNPD